MLSILLSAQGNNYDLGIAAYQASDNSKALEYFELALKEHPGNAEIHCYKALVYNEQSKYKQALKATNKGIQYACGNQAKAFGYYTRSQVYGSMHEELKAISDLTAASGYDSLNPDYYLERADNYELRNAYTKAELDYQYALKLDNSNQEVWRRLTRLYYIQKRPADFDAAL